MCEVEYYGNPIHQKRSHRINRDGFITLLVSLH